MSGPSSFTASRFGKDFCKTIKLSTSAKLDIAQALGSPPDDGLPHPEVLSRAFINERDNGTYVDPRIGPMSFTILSISAVRRSDLLAAEEATIDVLSSRMEAYYSIITLDLTYLLKLPGSWQQAVHLNDLICPEHITGAHVSLTQDAYIAGNESSASDEESYSSNHEGSIAPTDGPRGPSTGTTDSKALYCKIKADSERKIDEVLCMVEEILLTHHLF